MAAYEVVWGVGEDFGTADELAGYSCASRWGVEDPEDLAALERAARGASEVLYQLSGQTVRGLTTETVRPSMDGPDDYCSSPCSTRTTRIMLQWPIDEIIEVRLGGEVIDDWYVLDNHELCRARDDDGRIQYWPNTQRLDLPDTDEGTFSVRYTWGTPVPDWGKNAWVELACALLEFDRAGHCDRLPDGVTGVARQGINYNVQTQAEKLRTGAKHVSMPEVARFVGTLNPKQASSGSVFFSPDAHRLHRITHPDDGS